MRPTLPLPLAALLAGALACLPPAIATAAGLSGGGEKEPGWRNVETWRQAHGLPQATVFAVLQTRDGYIWVGTRGGVSRFDGVSFTTFDDRDKTQLRENEVWALVEGDDASLWIATFGGGLSRYKDGAFTVYTTQNGLISDFVAALARDRDGALWIGSDAGLTRFKDGAFTSYSAADGLDRPAVRALCADHDGTVWIGTTRGGVYRLKDGKIQPVAVEGLDALDDVRSLVVDREGALWVAAPTGLFRVAAGRTTRFGAAEGLLTNRMDGVYVDTHGTLWVTTDKGLSRYKDGRFHSYALGNLTALGEDHEGSLWIGYGEDGLGRLRQSPFSTYTTDDGLPYDFVTTIVEDQRHNVWIGTAAGLSVLRDGALLSDPAGGSLPRGWVLSLAIDRDERLWVGVGPQLFRSREPLACGARRCAPEFVEVRNEAVSAMSPRVIHQDRDGTLWIGTSQNGLARYDGRRFDMLTTKDGLASNAVRALCQDREGALWIGTRGGGLNRLKDGVWTTYTDKDGLASKSVQALHLDADGGLWIATRQGLNRLKNGRFTTYTVNDGLYDNFVYNFTEDRDGHLWMGCSKGVFRVARRALDDFAEGRAKSVTSTIYGVEHGLGSPMSVIPYFPSAQTTSDGRVWIATPRGVSVVDPRRIVTNALPPPVHIEVAEIDQHRFTTSAEATARPGRGDLLFRYTGLSYLAPEKVRFRYRLEGYDADWVDAGSRRMVQYTNIPPGGYRFRVVACNNDGVWNEQGASFSFRLAPRFHQTWWFYGLCIAAVALAGAGSQRLRVARLKARERELSLRVEQAVGQIKMLRGLLPVCASCKKIRDDKGYWNQMESYILQHSDAELSHGICPECLQKLYPDYAKSELNKG